MTNDSNVAVHVAPVLSDRIRGAIWGQLVGDAACLGSHWIYDTAEIGRLWPEGLRGFEEPAVGYRTYARTEQGTRDHLTLTSGHYHAGKRSGDQTHYGHGALLQLASVAERGGFDEADFGRRFVETFTAPTYLGYKDHAMRGTLANHAAFRAKHSEEPSDFQHGADDFEGSTYSRLAPVVAAHRDDPAFLTVIDRATRVTQNNTRAVAHAQCSALILRSLLRGQGLSDALTEAEALLPTSVDIGDDVGEDLRRARLRESAEMVPATESFGQPCRIDLSFPVGWPATMVTRPQQHGPMCLHSTCSPEADLRLPESKQVYDEVRDELRGALERSSEDVLSATAALGKGCRLNNSFPSALQCTLRNQADFRAAILDTARAGGDSAGRGSMIGAWLGASLGVEAIPRAWRERLTAGQEIERNVERLVARLAPKG